MLGNVIQSATLLLPMVSELAPDGQHTRLDLC